MARSAIRKRSYASPGVCIHCERATIVTHYDRSLQGYICADCAPMAILIDALLITVMCCSHPKPNQTPDH